MEFDLNDPEQAFKAFQAAESGQAVELPQGGESDADRAAREAQAVKDAADAAAAAEKAAADAAAAQAASAKQDVTPGGKVEATQDNESNAEGVLARDGKNVIPFSVLKSERDRAGRAEQLAKDQADQIAALKAQIAAGNQGAKPGESARTAEAAAETVLSDEELEAIREDFPTMHKALVAQQATIKALQAQQQQVEQERHQQQAERQRTQAEMVQEAIDATPKLAHIQATDPDRFTAAQRYDAVLRADPRWQGKPLAERFAEAVKLVETTHGAIEIPSANPPAAQKTPEQLKAEAEAVAKAAASKAVPTSMSDFPAGDPPAQSEQAALESMTPAQLADKFSKMSPEQMDAYLSKL
ncbi:hypothetical protein BKK79_00970 [Cupriavidus sp. USMAA2-4]|uniref:hypothetical protein n=1 Tax=Cupriavidus sp. USMAA2-4 TaxID=876364 RepID=UPI0008A68964|nr:hypothetical protein [Cupriavidus sp. USMAA2-4]AOY90557.1 hypothetical protein BKK79_00970 [Cupriavidus sp. USMAA2-4]